MSNPKSFSNYLRITNAGKTPGVFLTAQVITSPKESLLKMGKIFTVLQISHPSSSTRQIGQTIINALKRSYFKGDSTSDLQNFEKALKIVNETLAQIAQSGETAWIGNMDAVFCLVVENEAHLATAGKAQAWLIRENKISEIIDSNDQPLQPHPLKTFSSITSGSLISSDKVVLTSPKLQNYISAQRLRELLDEVSLQEIGEKLVRALKQTKEKAINLFVIEAQNSSHPSILDFYLDQPTDTPLNQVIKFSKKYFLPWADKVSSQAGEYFKSSVKLTQSKILPQSRKFLQTASQKSKKLAKEYTAKAKPKLKEARKHAKRLISSKKPTQKSIASEEYQNANIIGRSIYTINDYKNNHPAGVKKILRQLSSSVKKILYTLDNQIYNLKLWLTKGKKHPFSLILGALILIIILIVSISVQRKRQTEKLIEKQQQETLESAQQKLEQGQTALVFTDEETAALLFEEAIELAQNLDKTPFQDPAKEIIKQAINQGDILTHTSRIRPTKAFTDELSAKLLISFQGNAFVLTQNKPEIVKVNILGGNKSTINQIEADQGAWQQAIKLSDEHFYLLTDKGNIYDFNAKEESLKKINLNNNQLKKSVDFDSFANNLYLLSPQDSQIWKYIKQDSGEYRDPVKFAQRSLAKILAKAKAMAIDGAIYVLSDDKVIRISRGTKQDFKLKNIPKAFNDLSKAVDIFTNENVPSIYLLDATKPRIIEFDKNGNYMHQYLLPSSIKNPLSFQIDHIGKKAWILADNKGYEVDF